MPKYRKSVVVVGSGGRLGSSLVSHLDPDYHVVGLDRRELDLGSLRSIEKALESLDYDYIFLTGALTAVDYCEGREDEAFAVNGAGPGRIAEISAEKGAHLTYLSTDMVFDGLKEEPYVESDRPNPLNVYGASKLEGETRVLGASGENLVVRTSWVYGPGRPAFPEWILGRACEETRLTLPEDKVCCPTFSLDLIRWLTVLVLDSTAGPASGVFHLCGSGPCTWRDWGQFVIDTAREAGFPVVAGRIEGVPVDSVAAFAAKRPLNSALDTGKFSSCSGIRPMEWRKPLRDFVIQNESFARYRSSSS